jgi:hypothetical protein
MEWVGWRLHLEGELLRAEKQWTEMRGQLVNWDKMEIGSVVPRVEARLTYLDGFLLPRQWVLRWLLGREGAPSRFEGRLVRRLVRRLVQEKAGLVGLGPLVHQHQLGCQLHRQLVLPHLPFLPHRDTSICSISDPFDRSRVRDNE